MLKHRKVNRREMVWFLLSASGLLGGCVTRSGYKPELPESCVWVKFPYTWVCVDPEEGNVIPPEETALWGSSPLTTLDFAWTCPLQWQELQSKDWRFSSDWVNVLKGEE